MDPILKFNQEKKENIQLQGESKELVELGLRFTEKTAPLKYTYNFTWMGRPIIQFPQDIIAMQELIWNIQPDVIIETGVAHGGSIVFYASMLQLIGKGIVVGIDIDIRDHNRKAIEEHPMASRIKLIQGSSIDPMVVAQAQKFTEGQKTVMVILDSNHTHEHVLEELRLYSGMVTVNSYLVVFDTVVEDMPDGMFLDRPWGKGDNPKTAVWEFLKSSNQFEIDSSIHNKLLITVAPEGYLKRIR